jgi:DNA-binding transcriptional LysR family regulator
LNIEKLKSFYYTVKLGSVKNAAEHTSLSISGLTRQIASLEEELDHKLFNNVHQRLVLTPKGELLFERVSKILSDIDSTLKALDEDDVEVKGDITISTTNSIAVLSLMDYLAEFLRMYPHLNISILGSDTEHDLIIREADVAIRPFMEKGVGLKQEFLQTYEMNLYASEDYAKKYGLPKKVEELEKYSIIAHADSSPPAFRDINWHLRFFNTPKKPHIKINSGAGILRAVENSLGIGPVSDEGAARSRVPLIKVLPEFEGPKVDVFFIYPDALRSSARIMVLRKYLLDLAKKKASTTKNRRNTQA